MFIILLFFVAAASTSAPPLFGVKDVDCGRVPTDYKLSDATLSLQAHGCFGHCPRFSLTIEGDGDVIFAGEKYTLATGEQRATISSDQVFTILRLFYEKRFFQVPEEQKSLTISLRGDEVELGYKIGGDWATYTVTLAVGDAFSKAVQVNPLSPRELYDLVGAMTEVAETHGWVPPKGQRD